MKIAIDVSAVLGLQGGMQVYLQRLLKHLSKLDSENEYLLSVTKLRFSAEDHAAVAGLAQGNFTPHLRRFPYRLLMALQHHLDLRVEESWLLPRVDLYHGACQVVPPLAHTRSVMTVHHYEDPRYAYRTRWQEFYYKEVFEKSLARAGHLIADSKFTRRFLMEEHGVPREKITVIYHGIFDPKPQFAQDDLAALRAEWKLPPRFVACVSHIHPRKNTLRLVGAFRRLADHHPDLSLVLAGGSPDAAYLDEVRREIAKLSLERRVILTGRVPHDRIPAFYAAAEAFVLPSLLEGFGIPLIEAMSLGCPVAAADRTSIPEIVGDAGLLFDPENEEAIAEALRRILEDSALRRELKDKGLRRAAEFSWDEAARRTLAVYKKVAA